MFTAGGAFIRVFDHESPMTPYRSPDRELWPGLLNGVPTVVKHVVAHRPLTGLVLQASNREMTVAKIGHGLEVRNGWTRRVGAAFRSQIRVMVEA